MSDERTSDAGLVAVQTQIEALGRGEPPASPELDRLAAVVRRLSRWMLAERQEAEIARAARALETLSEQLGIDESGPATRFPRSRPENGALLANARGTHPLLGSANPVAPPIRMRVEGDRVVGDVRFDVRFEGNTGWAHGGFVAAGFDIIVVQAAKLSGRAGPTGSLSVRFLAPTPIGVDLRYEARFDRAEGRKLFAEGRLLRCDDGTVTAEAQAIAIAPR